MSILKVARMGHPVLRTKARAVERADFKSAAFQKLIDDLFDTMREYHGVGLAAPQIGISKRVAVVDVTFKDDPRAKLVLVNPEIIKKDGRQRGTEGCLSIPGYYAEVKRHERVVLRALDRNGKRYKVTAENNLLAHAIEHEMDHLNGVLYIDYLQSLDELKPVEEAKEPVEV